MGLLDSFGFDNIELWRSEEMQLVQVGLGFISRGKGLPACLQHAWHVAHIIQQGM